MDAIIKITFAWKMVALISCTSSGKILEMGVSLWRRSYPILALVDRVCLFDAQGPADSEPTARPDRTTTGLPVDYGIKLPQQSPVSGLIFWPFIFSIQKTFLTDRARAHCKQRSVKKSVNVPMLPPAAGGSRIVVSGCPEVEIIRHGLVTCKNKIKKTFTHDMIMTSRPRSNVLRFIIITICVWSWFVILIRTSTHQENYGPTLFNLESLNHSSCDVPVRWKMFSLWWCICFSTSISWNGSCYGYIHT